MSKSQITSGLLKMSADIMVSKVLFLKYGTHVFRLLFSFCLLEFVKFASVASVITLYN